MRANEYPVVNKRLPFRCMNCDARRSLGVQSHFHRGSIRCHKCGSVIQCSLNRRKGRRNSQAGKCMMVTQNGLELEVILHDTSLHGLWFDIPKKSCIISFYPSGDQVQVCLESETAQQKSLHYPQNQWQQGRSRKNRIIDVLRYANQAT